MRLVSGLAGVGLILLSCGDSAKEPYYDGVAQQSISLGDGAPVTDHEPETKNDEFLLVAPAFADAHIFVANPTIDSISKIGVRDPHPIEVIPVGLYPTLVKSVGGRVLVLNSGDHTISFVTALTNKTFTLPIPKEINDIAFNSLGHGIGYVDTDKLPEEIEGGSQATDLFSIIDIEQGLVVTKGISFAPKNIVFTASQPPMALLAADSKGVLVDLSKPLDKPTVLNFSGGLTNAPLEEAAVTPDGARAFFREQGVQGIRVVELGSGAKSSVAADAVPTDMDLSPDGQALFIADRASDFRIRKFDASVSGVPFVSAVTSSQAFRQSEFSADGSVAVLFTAQEESSVVGIYDVASGSVTDVNVQLPVQNVLIAPDGLNAILIHRSPTGQNLAQKITMLSLENGEEPDLDLAGELHKVVFTPDSDFAFLTTTKPNYVIALSLRTGLHSALELINEPLFMAPLPGSGGGHAFVTQEHEIGQVSFIQAEQTPSTVRITPDDVVGFLLGAVTE